VGSLFCCLARHIVLK